MNKVTTKLPLFIITILVCLCLLCSCVVTTSMDDWPRLELNLNVDNFDEVLLEYHHVAKPSNRNPSDIDINFYGSSFDREIINNIYLCINGLPYSEKTYNSINTNEFIDKVVVRLLKESETLFEFKFYSYGIKDGYFVFENGEIHRFHGDFVSISYGSFKNCLQQSIESR